MVVGLISGTSVDAIEAVVCRIAGTGRTVSLRLLSHVTLPFTPKFVRRVMEADSARELCALNFVLGELFAEAALAAIGVAELKPSQVDVIGSHGQTVAHLRGATLQLGEAAVIAERTGIPVVSDFRTRDVAAGGEGAPLVPYADWVLFRKPGELRALQNIGGIANVSVVSSKLEDTLAFDTGPGNMLLDAVVRLMTNGRQGYDRDGKLARKGEVMLPLLKRLCRHPFLKRPPPRSAGRDQFGESLANVLWKEFADRPYDLLATLVAFTVEATAQAYEKWVLPRRKISGVWLSGGGSRNPLLVAGFKARLAPLPVEPLDALGFPEGAKEAACFALLASEHLEGTPQNIPGATGARRRVLLGKLTP
ncbi:MAG: anhydro-N-acetylmuramic acid kinase [Myxococcaceae bacterium]|nr:anhydro-N-acetylmuramic acid kinase [Myxococcaceae bacterium]